MNDAVLLLSDPSFLEHNTGPGHPERADRLRAIEERLAAEPLPGTTREAASAAPLELLAKVHEPAYVERLEALRGQWEELDADTPLSPGSVEAAYRAAGAAMGAVEAVVRGRARASFALVRPPGHHAEAERAMGFCLFNNAAVAATYARTELGCERVLVVDWDVHHGNGTQHIFEHRNDVLVFNTHQFPFYPGSGSPTEVGFGEGAGFTVNVPLPPGLGDGDYVAAFRRVLVPVADAFRPDLVLVSAGFDAHRDDPLGAMNVTDEGFAALCGIADDIARRHAGGRIALLLEGGYDLAALARSVHACTRVLTGHAPPVDPPTSGGADRAVRSTMKAQAPFWTF
ncbi:MAG: histone deacetylase [Polyangiaceae bacterium]|jgi:acetoin utilization deacetylase AcuC-like enzyme|nr:histone deacetylase [Polyangiaceae bacterium]